MIDRIQVGLKYVEHDKRYEIADEFLIALYKSVSSTLGSAWLLTFRSRLWEGSWADDALVEDPETEIYSDYNKIRSIHHHGKYFSIDAPHILDPSPQRTPFLFQAGTSQ